MVDISGIRSSTNPKERHVYIGIGTLILIIILVIILT